MEYKSFAVILTAVEVETAAVKHCFEGFKLLRISGDAQEYYETTLKRDGAELKVITAQQKGMGMTAATLLASKATEQFRPKYLIMSGVAACCKKHMRFCQREQGRQISEIRRLYQCAVCKISFRVKASVIIISYQLQQKRYKSSFLAL